MRSLAPDRPAWEDLNAADVSEAEMICIARELARTAFPPRTARDIAPLERLALH